MENAELIITALQQRIGELTSNYETQIALLRAEITLLMNKEQEKLEESQKFSEELAKKVGIENLT